MVKGCQSLYQRVDSHRHGRELGMLHIFMANSIWSKRIPFAAVMYVNKPTRVLDERKGKPTCREAQNRGGQPK